MNDLMAYIHVKLQKKNNDALNYHLAVIIIRRSYKSKTNQVTTPTDSVTNTDNQSPHSEAPIVQTLSALSAEICAYRNAGYCISFHKLNENVACSKYQK